MFKFTRKPTDDYGDFNGGDDYYDPYKDGDPEEMENDGFGMSAPQETESAAPSYSTPALALKIVTPKGYDNAPEIVDSLINGNTVLLNLEVLQQDRAQMVRLVDYLKGAVHVCGGIITKAGKGTIVVAPKNVDVSSIEAMVNGN